MTWLHFIQIWRNFYWDQSQKNMSHKWHEDSTRHNAQTNSDYSEVSDVHRSLTGFSGGGGVQQHAIASPRTSKKRSFLQSFNKGPQRKGTIITRPLNHDAMPEESFEVRVIAAYTPLTMIQLKSSNSLITFWDFYKCDVFPKI